MALSFLAAAGLRSQVQTPDAARLKTTAPSADIFSGTVVKFTERSLTVIRKVAGQQAVTRQFSCDAGTTVEGKLRNEARVTVRYKATESGGFLAVHVIVR